MAELSHFPANSVCRASNFLGVLPDLPRPTSCVSDFLVEQVWHLTGFCCALVNYEGEEFFMGLLTTSYFLSWGAYMPLPLKIELSSCYWFFRSSYCRCWMKIFVCEHILTVCDLLAYYIDSVLWGRFLLCIWSDFSFIPWLWLLSHKKTFLT